MHADELIIEILTTIGLVFLFIAVMYLIARRRYGARVTNLLIPEYLTKGGCILILATILDYLNEYRSLVAIGIVVSLLFAIALLTIQLVRKQYPKDTSLYDFSQMNMSSRSWFTAFTILGAIHLFLALVFLILNKEKTLMSDASIYSFSISLFFLMLAIYFAVYAKKAQTFFTETHFLGGSKNLKWNELEDFIWGKDWGGKTLLVLRRARWFSCLRHIKLEVPTHQKIELDLFLNKVIHSGT
jgi:hypothetical protein